MDEGQGDKFGEAAGLFLQGADAQQVARPVAIALDMAEHDRRGAAQADAMGHAHHFDPFVCADLVRAYQRADFGVEYLGRGAGQGGEARRLQLRQIILQRQAQRMRAMGNFQRGESVDMDVRRGFAHGLQNGEIGVAVIVGMDAPLQADFGGAAIPCFGRAPSNLGIVEPVGGAAHRLRTALRKGAEAAFVEADIGVVDVAIDGIGQRVADSLLPQPVGLGDDGSKVVAIGIEQGDDVTLAQARTSFGVAQERLHRCRCLADIAADQRGRVVAMPGGPIVGLGQAASVDRAQDKGCDRRRGPILRRQRVTWPDGKALGKRAASGAGGLRQCLQMGPWGFGVHMVGRHRRHPAPVVYPGPDQRSKIDLVVEVGRRLDRHVRSQDQPRGGDRPEMIVERRFGMFGHPRARLGPEILDDDFLNMAILAMQVADGDQRVDLFVAGFADADQQPGGERHFGAARLRDRGQTTRRLLVGRAEMRAATRAQPICAAFQHDAHRRGMGAQQGIVGRVHQAGVEVGQQAGFAQDQFRHFGEVGKRGIMAQPGQRVARRGIAVLGPVAQGEQRLPAPGLSARARDRQDFFAAEIGVDRRRRCGGKGAVMADVAA